MFHVKIWGCKGAAGHGIKPNRPELSRQVVGKLRWRPPRPAPSPRSKGAYLCRPIKQNPIMDVRKIVNQTVKIVFPLLLGVLLFWYLYREQDFGAMMEVVRGGVR